MRKILLIVGAGLGLSGCGVLFNDESVAGGGCERKTTYGVEFQVAGIGGNFALAADCKETATDD